MAEPEKVGLICAPVRSDWDRIVSGSIIAQCDVCSADVWVAPTGQQIMAQENAVPLCMPCGKGAIAADPAPDIKPLSEAQKAEIRKALGSDA